MILTNCEVCDPMAGSPHSSVTVNVGEIFSALSWPVCVTMEFEFCGNMFIETAHWLASK